MTYLLIFAVALLLLALALWKGSKRDKDVFMSSDEWKGKQAALYYEKKARKTI
jgi:hypothetical protein